jgi:2-alkyl-3-oxoalkanoate reductase
MPALESRVLSAPGIEGVALRYGFFYGPGTWYDPQGAAADQARKQELAIIGTGGGVWSWIHIEDAAAATAAALTAPPGTYHIVDDHPSPVSRWLPAFSRWVAAPPPRQLTEQEGREQRGEDAVYYGTRLRGATNGKAKKLLGFSPRPLSWLD